MQKYNSLARSFLTSILCVFLLHTNSLWFSSPPRYSLYCSEDLCPWLEVLFPGARALTAVMSEERLTGATICPGLLLHFIYAIEHIVNSAHSSSLINYPGVDTHSDFFHLKSVYYLCRCQQQLCRCENLLRPTVFQTESLHTHITLYSTQLFTKCHVNLPVYVLCLFVWGNESTRAFGNKTAMAWEPGS